MADERTLARMRLGLDRLPEEDVPASTPVVDEQTKAQAMREQAPEAPVEITTEKITETLPIEQTSTASTTRVNKYEGMTIEEITAKRAEERNPENATASRATRMAELKTQREAGALQRALARAATAPEYNFTQRPAGYIDEGNGVLRYYGWNGGKETGRWVAREAILNKTNYDKYKNLIPAAEIAVSGITSKSSGVKDGFILTNDGQLKVKGNADMSILGIKSDSDMEKILGKRAPREEAALNRALERAQKSQEFNFLYRPAGRITEDKILFYSWIGGKENGQWYLYEAVNNEENLNKYQTLTREQTFFKPTSIRDVLIPTTNILGKGWRQAAADKKVVPDYNPEIDIKLNLTGPTQP